MTAAIFAGLDDLFAETFGEDVVYTPLATGVPATIPGIVFDEPIDVEFSESGASDNRKMLHLREADVAAPAEGDLAAIGAVTWKVVPPFKPDGKGMVAVQLARRS